MNRMSLDITSKAQKVFTSPALASAWLDRPSALCNGLSPRQAATDPNTRTRLLRQLDWFEGTHTGKASHSQLNDVLSDPMINLVLRRAGSGPEELLALCNAARDRKCAA